MNRTAPRAGVRTCVLCQQAILGNNYRFTYSPFAPLGIAYEHFPCCPFSERNHMTVPTAYQEALDAAHKERGEILDRIHAIFDRLKLDPAPSLTPFTSESSAPALADAIRAHLEVGGPTWEDGVTLSDALSAAETPEGTDYGDTTTPVVVVSLAGLRTLEAVFTELEQRRGAEPDAH